MAGGSSPRDDDELITQINVTPLVDVVLVLLIILMVTASYIVSRAIPMELPRGEGGPTQPEPLTVSINAEGELFINAQPVEDEAFRGRIRSYVAGLPSREDARATIAADGRITHSLFIHVISMLRSEGVTRYAINVRPEDLQ